jgi:hypothetical protein
MEVLPKMEVTLIIIMHVEDALAYWKLLAWYIHVQAKTM